MDNKKQNNFDVIENKYIQMKTDIMKMAQFERLYRICIKYIG